MAAVKKSTGLVGLPVVPNAREELIKIYAKTLEKVKMFPADVEYRKGVEQITNYRLSVVKRLPDHEAIEEEIDCGQVEELLDQAQDELELMDLLQGSEIVTKSSES